MVLTMCMSPVGLQFSKHSKLTRLETGMAQAVNQVKKKLPSRLNQQRAVKKVRSSSPAGSDGVPVSSSDAKPDIKPDIVTIISPKLQADKCISFSDKHPTDLYNFLNTKGVSSLRMWDTLVSILSRPDVSKLVLPILLKQPQLVIMSSSRFRVASQPETELELNPPIVGQGLLATPSVQNGPEWQSCVFKLNMASVARTSSSQIMTMILQSKSPHPDVQCAMYLDFIFQTVQAWSQKEVVFRQEMCEAYMEDICIMVLQALRSQLTSHVYTSVIMQLIRRLVK